MHFFSIQHLTAFFAHYGYWTVLAGLLLESAGLPLPGETLLLVASSLAARHAHLRIEWVLLLAIAASATGDNLAYLIGHRGGRPLLRRYGRLFHITPARIEEGEAFMRRHGAKAVFFARFVAGLRVINGLLAGSLQMEWRRFLLWNLLGAACWASAICMLGFFFGSKLPWLLHTIGVTGFAIGGGVVLAGLVAWWLHKRRSERPATR